MLRTMSTPASTHNREQLIAQARLNEAHLVITRRHDDDAATAVIHLGAQTRASLSCRCTAADLRSLACTLINAATAMDQPGAQQ